MAQCEDREGRESLARYVLEPGVLDIPRLQADGLYPSDERLAAGPIAVFECGQEIPCNPCESACRQGFVEIGEDITSLPVVDPGCTGCGLCLPACPGLSIFILDATFGEAEAAITLPHELLPVPQEGERVHGLDRRGATVCEGTVVRVRKRAKDDPCLSVTVAVPKRFLHDVRQIARITGEQP